MTDNQTTKTKKMRAKDNPMLAETLHENEKKANRLCCKICVAVAAINLTSVILNLLGVYKMSGLAAIVWGIVIVILIVPGIMNRTGRFHSGRMKTIILTSSFLACLLLDAICNYNVALVIALPVIMAALYFDIRTVVVTSVATVILFGAETYFAAYNMLFIDNNHANLPEGTVLVLENGMKKAILAAGLDPTEYALNMLLMGYMPKILMMVAFFALAIAIAKYGHEMILRQAEVTAEQTRISTELSVANKLQADALPDVADINGRFGFELAADMRAARETGGDFYDFAMLDDDHLAILIADVSDKGVPAAMFMMSAKSTISADLRAGMKPSEIMAKVNDRLFANNKEGMFVTVWLGIYEISTGTLTSTNAGHEDPIMYKPETGFAEIKEQHGVLVGEFEGMAYSDNVTEFRKGDVLFLYTDGVSEACNEAQEMYGVDRLLACLNRDCAGGSAGASNADFGSASDMSAEEIMEAVRVDIRNFAGGAEQFDDLTVVVLKA